MDNNTQTTYYNSPIGVFTLRASGDKLTHLLFGELDGNLPPVSSHLPVLTKCMEQLDEYFNGKRKVFDLPLDLRGTEFRRRVWAELERIPYGETRTYKDIAAAIGNVKAVRAVGGANHHNPVSIIVPCHRVVGADGGMTGYGGEIWRKEWLLEHEKK